MILGDFQGISGEEDYSQMEYRPDGIILILDLEGRRVCQPAKAKSSW